MLKESQCHQQGHAAEDFVIDHWRLKGGKRKGIQSNWSINEIRQIGKFCSEFMMTHNQKLSGEVYDLYGVEKRCGGAPEITLHACQDLFVNLPAFYLEDCRREALYNAIRKCAQFHQGKYLYPVGKDLLPRRGRPRKLSVTQKEEYTTHHVACSSSLPTSAATALLLLQEHIDVVATVAVVETRPKALMLGMCLSEWDTHTSPQINNSSRSDGQLLRDGLRLKELSKHLDIYTFDDKHSKAQFSTVKEERHCTGKYSQPYGTQGENARTFHPCLQSKWPGVCFDYIIVDYFFMPTGYSRDRQGSWLPRDDTTISTVESIAVEKLLNIGGKIVMANNRDVSGPLNLYLKRLQKYYDVLKLPNDRIDENLLWKSTTAVDAELNIHGQLNYTKDQQKYTNGNQRQYMDIDYPFFVLTIKAQFANVM